MRRSFFWMVLMLLLSFLLLGCADPEFSDYELWKNSDDAEDLNGDRKINEEDYEIYLEQGSFVTWKDSDDAEDLNDDQKIDEVDYAIYLVNLAYEAWRDSDDAEDLNGDRKIDKLDYELFLNPEESDYDIWKDSDDASDFNSDGSINEADYVIFLQFSEFLGEYTVANYTYDGSVHTYVGNKLYLHELGDYLAEITFTIDSSGEIHADIPSSVIASFEDDFAIVLQGLSNINIHRLSPLLVGLDTSVTIDGVVVNITLYMTQIENGFRTSYIMNHNDENGLISFDLIKE
jgi:hypothetical protein